MLFFAEILIWLSLLGLVHTYLIYPLLLRILAIGKKPNQLVYDSEEALPPVSVLMSAFNEERVIHEKIESLLAIDYPADRLRFFIGSDDSTDATNAILQEVADRHPSIHFYPFSERRGKPIVVNDLVEKAARERPLTDEHIFLFTDASVMLEPGTLKALVKHYKNPDIFLVDANMLSKGAKAAGISRSEDQYLGAEVKLKHLESIVWGKMIGPFGGCYSMRSSYYAPVPKGYLVDDFYITMKGYEKGGNAINALEARCWEGLSHNIWEEYRRKSRISAGSFKNLATFRHLLWPPFSKLAFGFFSHKVLRWFGPFFIIFASIGSLILSVNGNFFYTTLLLLLVSWLFLLPVLDLLLKKLGIHSLLLRNIRYFNFMNLALLEGFFKYLKGQKTNVWQPPRRDE